MPPNVLTEPRNEVDRRALAFIREYVRENGRGPTVREIGAAVGLTNPNNGRAILQRLIRDGFIGGELANGQGRPRTLQLDAGRLEPLPMRGRVSCGEGKVPDEDGPQQLDLRAILKGGDFVTFEAVGDSMVEAHITAGDYLICRPVTAPRSGAVVVAMVGGKMVCKRFQKLPRDRVRLEPKSGKHDPIEVDAWEVNVLGVLHSVFRRA